MPEHPHRIGAKEHHARNFRKEEEEDLVTNVIHKHAMHKYQKNILFWNYHRPLLLVLGYPRASNEGGGYSARKTNVNVKKKIIKPQGKR